MPQRRGNSGTANVNAVPNDETKPLVVHFTLDQEQLNPRTATADWWYKTYGIEGEENAAKTDAILDEFSGYDRPVLIHRDSEFSVGTAYDGEESPNNLNMWQGAALLTADCLGTGLLALPADIQTLGWGLGLTFLIANLPINLYAGTIFHLTATAVEQEHNIENMLYSRSLSDDGIGNDDGNDNINTPTDYQAINQDTANSKFSVITTGTHSTAHTKVHHDTATFDFIGMTQALFQDKTATRLVMLVFYTNIFLVLGNYILVMSHAVAATIGEDRICLPVAGLIASVGMFAVSQLRTMAKLGRTASILSLSALFVVVVQCLWECTYGASARQWDANLAEPLSEEQEEEMEERASWLFFLRKLSAMGSIGFAVGSQKLFLNIRHELADRRVAPKSLAISLSCFGVVYVLIVILAGPNPPSFLFDAIPLGTWKRKVAGFLLWAHVVVSYAINSQAICSSMDRLIWHKISRNLPSFKQDGEPFSGAQRWMVLTGIMAVAAYTVANAIPFFKDLVALIGSITSVPLTLLLPAIFWREHLNVPLLSPTRNSLWSIGLTYFSIIFMVAATIGSLYSIQKDWSEQGAPFACH